MLILNIDHHLVVLLNGPVRSDFKPNRLKVKPIRTEPIDLKVQVGPNRTEPLKLKRADGTDGTDGVKKSMARMAVIPAKLTHDSGQDYNAGQISLIIPARTIP